MTEPRPLVRQRDRTRTRVQVQFYSDIGFDGQLDSSKEREGIGRIVGFTSQKSFGSAAGSFSITVKKTTRIGQFSWTRFWPDPEDTWIQLWVTVDGQRVSTMFGLIDSISESVVRSGGGQRTETIQIQCRDVGKVFEQTQLFVNFIQGESRIRNVLAIHQGVPNGALIGPPSTFIRALVDLWVGNNGMAEKQWELPSSLGAASFYDLLNLSTIQDMDAGNGETFDNNLLNPDQQGGSLWDTMQQYANGLMNELWIDLAPDPDNPKDLGQLRPALYLRERMFKTRTSHARWDRLRTRILRPEDVTSRQMAKGGAANRYNYWKISGGLLNGGDYSAEFLTKLPGDQPYRPGAIPIVNEESIRLHGVRKFEQRTDFLPITASRGTDTNGQDNGQKRQNFLTLAANWLARIHDWYAPAPYELTGQLTTARIFPEIRIGEKLEERRPEGTIHYYVEGVSHTWMYPGAGQTTLTLTHGEFEDEEVLDRIYEQYDRPNVVKEEDCFGRDFTNEEDGDDVIRAIAAGCRHAVVSEGASDEFTVSPDDEATVGAGLPAEGAATRESSQATVPDGAMLPKPNDADSSHASAVASGTTQNTRPDLEVETKSADVALSQAQLEADQPISIEDAAILESESDDPLLGIL